MMLIIVLSRCLSSAFLLVYSRGASAPSTRITELLRLGRFYFVYTSDDDREMDERTSERVRLGRLARTGGTRINTYNGVDLVVTKYRSIDDQRHIAFATVKQFSSSSH